MRLYPQKTPGKEEGQKHLKVVREIVEGRITRCLEAVPRKIMKRPKHTRVRKLAERMYRKPFLLSPHGVFHLVPGIPPGDALETKFHEGSYFQDPDKLINRMRRLVALFPDGFWKVFFDKSPPEVVHQLLKISPCLEADWNLHET